MPCKRVKINELFHEQLWNEMNGFIMCYSRIWSLELPQFSHLQHLNRLLSLYRCYCSERWSPVHMNIPELSSFFSVCLKQEKYPHMGSEKFNIETKRYSTQSSPSITAGDPWKTNMRLTFLSSNNHLLRQMIVSCSLDYCAARSCPHKSRRTALLSNFIDSSLAQCVHFKLHSVITWLRDSTLCVWHFFFLI